MKTKIERLSRVRNFLYSTPWAMRPEALEAMIEIFEKRLIDEDKTWITEAASKFHQPVSGAPFKDEYVVNNGVATIRFVGPIMPRANAMQTSGATSLELQMQKFSHALQSKDVGAILLDFDTPGGSALGLEEAAQQIFEARSNTKPVIAIANAMCCSAGYYLACQADEFYASPAAMVGSIGVRMVVETDERQRKNEGIDTEYAYVSGPLKGGVGPMTSDQKSEMQRIGDLFFSNFKDAVTRARPMINIDDVATGGVWIGKEALSLGLVDGISTLEKLQASLAA